VSVCELLTSLQQNNGSLISVRGELVSTDESLSLRGECSERVYIDGFDWPSAISIVPPAGDRSGLGAPPKAGQIAIASVIGRLETRQQFETVRTSRDVFPIGFGHVNRFPAELVVTRVVSVEIRNDYASIRSTNLPRGNYDELAARLLAATVKAKGGFGGAAHWIAEFYADAEETMKDRIALLLAENYGLCVGRAKDAWQRAAERHGDYKGVQSWWMSDEQVSARRRSDITLMEQEPPQTDLRERLTVLSCRVEGDLRLRARELLGKYFGRSSDDIICPKCE